MNVWAVLIFLLVALSMQQYLKARMERIEAGRKSLLAKWHTARQERMLWWKANQSLYNFDHPEYQRLWNIEIGAEDLYMLHANTGLVLGRSWRDYCYERNEFENDAGD